MTTHIPSDLISQVHTALQEDLGSGDITAALIPTAQTAQASVITRQDCIVAGRPWVDEVFRQLDLQYHQQTLVEWYCQEGEPVKANQTLFTLNGSARTLLTGERNALNFLQLLSATATRSYHYNNLVKHTQVQLLDTRKTLPGLRTAQKYAVRCGGCHNHRIGLYDAYLIKENHIAACGGIGNSIINARQQQPNKTVEVEVENFNELREALSHHADIIMLDNFSLDALTDAVAINQQQAQPAKLEASGGITDENLASIAETGVDYISLGTLTKDCQAIDLSMRIQSQ